MTFDKGPADRFWSNISKMSAVHKVNDKSGDIGVEVLIDSREAIDMTEGYESFYEHGIFDSSAFDDDRTLIMALMMGEWLGPVAMLSPHQAEYVRKIANRNRNSSTYVRSIQPDRFLLDVGLQDRLDDIESELRGKDWASRVGVVRKYAGDAQSFFRVLEFVPGTWRTRFLKWKKRGLFQFSGDATDLVSSISDPDFGRIFSEYDKERGGDLSKNNFFDAVALVHLKRKVYELNSAGVGPIPIYFDPDGVTALIVDRAGVSESFLIQRGGVSFSALQDSSFLLYYTISLLPEMRKDFSTELSDPEEVRRLALIYEFFQDTRGGAKALLATPTSRGRPIKELVADFESFSFFDSIWAQSLTSETLHGVRKELTALAGNLLSKDYQGQIREDVEKVRLELKSEVDAYGRASFFWTESRQNLAELRLRFKRSNSLLKGELYFHFGFVRFSFAESVAAEIRQDLRTLITGSEKESEALRSFVVDLYLVGLDGSAGKAIDVSRGASVMYALGMKREVLDFLSPVSASLSSSLSILLAACAIEVCPKTAKRLVANLEERVGQADSSELQRLSIGLAYLYFRSSRRASAEAESGRRI